MASGGHLITCSRCGRHFPVTLWKMHAHNPEQMHCTDARCRERAVGYCADAPFQLGLGPLCQTHLMEHRRLGHDVRFVDGGACGVCNGRGEIASQAADAETPGGRWVRCLQCQGSGYVDEETLDRGRRSAAEREQARREEIREHTRQEHAQREHAQREHAQREQAQREQPPRDTEEDMPIQDRDYYRERWRRGGSSGGEQAQREQARREQAQQEQAQREQAQQEQAQREQAQREQAQREQAQREQAQREQAQRAQAQREQARQGHALPEDAALEHARHVQTQQARQEQARQEQAQRGKARRRGCCWFIAGVILAALIAGGAYYYWTTLQEADAPAPPTDAAALTVTPTQTPTPTPTPVLPAAAAPTPTPTQIPCADPTPTSAPTATATATPPAATPTPEWPPAPLSDAWREWALGWSSQQVDAALAQSNLVLKEGLDDLEGLPLSVACPRVAAFEVQLEVAEYLVDVHRLQRESVPGQRAAITWRLWLRVQRELLGQAVSSHAPVAECRSLLATPTPTPSPTAPPVPTPTPSATPSAPLPPCPPATATPRPTATPTATPRPRPTATPTPRATATPTPQPQSSGQKLTPSEIQELQRYAVELVNKNRAAHGLSPVTLGMNEAAQLHAEDMIEHGYGGHWWVDGRDPTQVYSETGGTSYAQENTNVWECSFPTNCRLAPPRDAVVRLQQTLMGSPGHRRNILDPAHQTLNIGIAYNGWRYTFAQIFSGGAAEADAPLSLSSSGGTYTLAR